MRWKVADSDETKKKEKGEDCSRTETKSVQNPRHENTGVMENSGNRMTDVYRAAAFVCLNVCSRGNLEMQRSAFVIKND